MSDWKFERAYAFSYVDPDRTYGLVRVLEDSVLAPSQRVFPFMSQVCFVEEVWKGKEKFKVNIGDKVRVGDRVVVGLYNWTCSRVFFELSLTCDWLSSY